MKKHSRKKTVPVSKKFPRAAIVATTATVIVLTIGVVFGISRSRASSKDPMTGKQSVVKTQPTAYVTRYVGGQTVQIDAQTGQVRPLTPEEAQRLAEGLKSLANQSTEGLEQVRHADGSVSMELQDRFQNVALAQKQVDGKVAQTCVDNPQAGAAFFGLDQSLVAPVDKSAAVASSKSSTNK